MKHILFIIIALVPYLTFGTNQIREKIIYKGSTNTLFTLVLSDEMRQKVIYAVDPATGKKPTSIRSSTACRRGYVGLWEFRGDSLYLVKLQDGVDRKDIAASQLIPGAEYPIKASWFTGELRIGTGSSYMRFSSTEVFLSMTNGVLTAVPEHIDRLQEQKTFKSELASLKSSQNQLERDLYEYVMHYNGPNSLDNKIDAYFEICTRDLSEVRYPNCNVYSRVGAPAAHIRSYVKFKSTSEPRVYQAESIHRKLGNPEGSHFVAFLEDRVLTIYGTPKEHSKITWEPAEDGQNKKIHIIKTKNPELAKQECFDAIVRFRDMLGGETIIPDGSKLDVSIALSTNVLSISDPLKISVEISNQGSEPVSICIDDLEVDFLLEDSEGNNSSGYGKRNWMVWGAEMPVILKAGESKPFGTFQASVWNRVWSDYSAGYPFPEYRGVGLEVKEAILETGYPMKKVPGDYFISVQIRVQKDDGTELIFISHKQKIYVNGLEPN